MRIRTPIAAGWLSALMFLIAAAVSGAAPSDRDASFGIGGAVQLTSAEYPSLGLGQVAVQGDGKVLATGAFLPGAAWTSAVWRFNADGSRDNSFSGDGVSDFTMPQPSKLNAIALQGDKILAGGGYGSGLGGSFMVARFHSDGTLDGGFGDVGTPGRAVKACPVYGQSSLASVVPIDDGGSAVLAYCQTSASSAGLQVYRFDSSGHWMSGWSGDGVTTIAPGPDYHYAGNMFPDGNGHLVIAGYYKLAGGHRQGMAARINISNGSFDGGFGLSGVNSEITPPVGGSGLDIFAGALLPSGKIALAGSQENQNDWAFAQLGSDGFTDPAFGAAVFTDPGVTVQSANDIDVVPGLGTVAAGYATFGTDRNSVLAARDFAGSPLTTFGSSAGVLVDGVAGINDEFGDAATAPDGRLVAVRAKLIPTPSSHWDYDIIRYSGTYVVPPVVAPLAVTLSKPAKSKLRASKSRSFSGIASGDGLARVQIAILRVDSKLLKRSRRCRWLTGSRASFKKYKAVRKKCSAPAKWLTAKGTLAWSYKLKKTLKPGKYVVTVRAGGAGSATSPTVAKRLTLTK